LSWFSHDAAVRIPTGATKRIVAMRIRARDSRF
jgi:hypothetical protein